MTRFIPAGTPFQSFTDLKNGLDEAYYEFPNGAALLFRLSSPTAASLDSICYLGNGIVLYGTSNGHIIISRDYGQSFIDTGVQSNGGSSINAISYFGGGIVVFGDNNGHVFRSVDYGLTWTDIGAIIVGAINTITYLSVGIAILAGASTHVWRTTTYGTAWTDLGAISTTDINTSTCPGDDSTTTGRMSAIIADANGNIFRNSNATTGNTWTSVTGNPISSSSLNTSISIGGGVSLVADDSRHIYRSSNYGVSWSLTTNAPFIGVSVVNSMTYLGNGIVVAVNANGDFIISHDLGRTWVFGNLTASSLNCTTYLGNGILLTGASDGTSYFSDRPFKLDETQSNYTRRWTNITASRALNTTYTNSDPTRTLQIKVGVRCQITLATGIAYAQSKSDTATPPVTISSPIVGIQAGLAGEDNNFEIVSDVEPSKKYRVDSTTDANGTVTLDSWFEMYL